MSEPPTSPLLTPGQCAKLLGLSLWTIYRLTEGRQLPHFRLGQGTHGRIRFDPAELDRWLQGHHVAVRDESRRLRRRP
jgi:excisionase family DNA binding protein